MHSDDPGEWMDTEPRLLERGPCPPTAGGLVRAPVVIATTTTTIPRPDLGPGATTQVLAGHPIPLDAVPFLPA